MRQIQAMIVDVLIALFLIGRAICAILTEVRPIVAGVDDPGRRQRRRLQLLPQCLLQTLFRLRWKLCVRYFANLFRKFTGYGAHVFELFRVPLAKRAHEIMDPQFNSRDQRQVLFHSQ
jgi:hypothetical protein